MRSDLRDIINCLNANRIRATYAAVGAYLAIPAIGVGSLLGPHRPCVSWIVDDTSGRPPGYTPEALHQDLFMHEVIISDAQELSNLLYHSRTRSKLAD
jgi:hypothetical protein